ncbi:concentrative nucleoside transporter [Parelusimicrobium proximum]|uniref:NupC/NupG family nucleoside CNT transporter n=1 Tax=Parelusimicrobium proximum TaxID=3228953 RepID=UPI003D1669C0
MSIVAGLLGFVVFIAIAYGLSRNRRAINWQTVGWAAGLQVVFALFILKTSAGKAVFAWIDRGIMAVLEFQQAGAAMVFGDLAFAEKFGYIFAFQVIPTIIFFSALMSFLYYIGVMQWVVKGFAWVMEKTCKISGAESLSASANIFVGQTEAPLLIKPYVEKMTKSELMCVMTGGMATVAGGVMAAYIAMLKDTIPGIAGHLMAASVMGAPAAVMFAKIIVPETETPATVGGSGKLDYKDPSANVLDAISNGTTTGLQLALNVAAMLIAFTALIALANGCFEWITGGIFRLTGVSAMVANSDAAWLKAIFTENGAMSLQSFIGLLFSPLAWLMGVPAQDIITAGRLIGEKTVLNEFVAYANFAAILNQATAAKAAIAAGTMSAAESAKVIFMTYKTEVILSYALCGFANFASIGIQIGGIGAIAPSRRADLSRIGLLAMIAGLLAGCFRAILAGMLV